MTGFIDIDGDCLAYNAAGIPSGQPIIFVHGLMSHRSVWAHTIEALKDQHYCIAIDLLGFGDSSKPDKGDYSIRAQAERILKTADYLGFPQFSLAGHSMGAQISLYLSATMATNRVLKLASISGVVTGKLTTYTRMVNMQLVRTGRYIPWFYKIIHSMSRHPPFANWAFKVWFADPARLPFCSWALDRRQALNPASAISAYEAYRSLQKTNLTSLLPGLNIPVLAIHGEQDGTVPLTDARLLKERAPQTNLVLFNECGHFPMYENFDTYLKHMQEFFNNQN
jgi:pimeloyl-ACP methyl ester carboxylesterase